MSPPSRVVLATLGIGLMLHPCLAPAAELNVSGRMQPLPCTVSLSRAHVDLGQLPYHRLNRDRPTVLGKQHVVMNVQCPAARRFSIAAMDNQRASANLELAQHISFLAGNSLGQRYVRGLGKVKDQRIGAYALRLVPNNGLNVIASDNFGGWVASSHGALNAVGADPVAFSRQGTPVALSNVEGLIEIETVIEQASLLPGTDALPLEGSTTLQLYYE